MESSNSITNFEAEDIASSGEILPFVQISINKRSVILLESPYTFSILKSTFWIGIKIASISKKSSESSEKVCAANLYPTPCSNLNSISRK